MNFINKMSINNYKIYLYKYYFKWIYFNYYLFNRNNLLFDIYGRKIVNKHILLNINPQVIEYAIPWKIFLDTRISVNNLRAPENFNVAKVAGWYRRVFSFDYNTPDMCTIMDGGWDDLTFLSSFKDNLACNAFKSVFREGVDWKDTKYYDYFSKYVYPNGDDLKARLEYNEFLFNEIERDGFKSEVIPKEKEFIHPETPRHLNQEIKVALGRDNELIFVDGNHRLSMAKILNCKEIIVRVVLAHPEADLNKLLE